MRRTTIVHGALLAAAVTPAGTAAAAGPDAATLTVVQRVAPAGTSVTGAVAAGAGWALTAATETADVGGLPSTLATAADGSGAVTFPLTFGAGVPVATVTVGGPRRSDFAVVPQGAANASCRDGDGAGAVVPAVDVAPTALFGPAFLVPVVRGADVRCVVVSRALPTPAPTVAPGPPDTVVTTTVTSSAASSAPLSSAPARRPAAYGTPRLTLQVRASRLRAGVGDRVRYTVTVRNLGGATANRARVCANLPRGVALTRRTGGRRACWTVATLRPGYAASRTLSARITSTATTPSLVTRASVTSGGRTTRARRTVKLG